jgi:hypothetical protein
MIWELSMTRQRGAWGLLGALVLGIAGAAGTALFGFFREDVAVRVASLIVSGPLDGQWIEEALEYDDDPAGPKPVRRSGAMTLQQLSFRVIGESRTTHRRWTISGYYNQPFLSLTNVSASGTSGLGSFTGRAAAEGNLAFLGVRIAVNCKGGRTTPVLLKCPALLVRKGHGELVLKYEKLLDASKCEEIAPAELVVARSCPPTPEAQAG